MMKQYRERKRTGRKKSVRLLSVMLCVCLVITACPYMPGTAVVQAASDHDHSGWTAWNNGSAMPSSAGNYYLTANVSLSGTEWTVPRGTTNLCLNGKTIQQNGGDRVIKVPSGATFNLYDDNNAGKITGGEHSYYGGGILVEGTCTMNGGQVTGNTVDCTQFPPYGGGGISVKGGTFTMKGGIISNNNSNGFHGGGMNVIESGSATMTRGTITKNHTTQCGGGVYVESGSEFTMSSGEISYNIADNTGGGANVDGTFTMSGGSIIGNEAKTTGGGGAGGIEDYGEVILKGGTISGNTAIRGGGVLYDSGSSKLEISGSPVIDGNTNTSGAKDNLYLQSGKLITFGDGGLKSGAHIGIKTKKTTDSCSSGVNLTGSCTNYSSYFTSDVTTYTVGYNSGKICLIIPHEYNYSVSGDTITQGCNNCNMGNTAQLRIKEGASLAYTGSPITPLEVYYSEGWVGERPQNISYPSNNINPGDVTASFTFNGMTATYTFTIESVEMEVSASGYDGTYDGNYHGITVNAPAGAIVKYGNSEGSCTEDSSPTRKDVGTTTVYYEVTKTNYKTVKGSATVAISECDISSAEVTLQSGTLTYNGSRQTKEVSSVKVGNRKLTPGTDYTLSGNKQTDAGTYTITITGTGNYKGTTTTTFTIASAQMSGVSVSGYNKAYDGNSHGITVNAPGATVQYGTSDGNYTSGTSPTFTNVGTHTVYYKITKPNYIAKTGSATVKINQCDISSAEVTLQSGTLTYNGSQQTKEVSSVTVGDRALTPGTDYDVSGNKQTDVGTYTITITGTGNYTGTKNVEFSIASAQMSGVSVSGYNKAYDGNSHGITVKAPTGATVKYGTSSGSCTKDYSPVYTDVGTYTVYYKITKPNYIAKTGSATVKINKCDISSAKVELKSGDLTYSGSQQTKEVSSVTVGDRALTPGTDYTVSGNKQTDVGTYTITITGTGNYSGIKDIEFTIASKPLTDDMVSIASGPYYYTGSGIMLGVTVTDGNKTLKKDTDYTIKYENNVNQGTAKVTVTGTGDYSGSIEKTFPIEYRTLPSGKSLTDYVTISPEPTNDWYGSDITLTPNDDCSVGESSVDIESSAVTISEETGTEGSTKTIYVKDSNGNIYQTEFTYKLDKTPPTVDLTDMTVENGAKNLWDLIIGKKSMIIKIPTAGITETLSGIEEVSYTVEPDNGTAQTKTICAKDDYYEIALNAEFSGLIKLTVKDKAGNTTQVSLTADSGKVIAEDYAPVVTFTLPDTSNADGWYNTDIEMKVTVTDDKDSNSETILSGGIGEIKWKDGEDGTVKTVPGLPDNAPAYEKEFNIPVTEDGTHTYYVNVIDNAGNESGWQSVTIKLDTGKPNLSDDMTVTNPTEEGADVIITPSEGGKVYWSVSDTGTVPSAQEVKEQSGQNGGVQDVTGGQEGSFTITGLTPGEKHTVYVVLEDAAGNMSEVKKESFFTMPKAPEITLEQLTVDYINETIKLPETIGNVEVYTDSKHPENSKITPNADGFLPVTPGTAIYIRYPERTQDSLTVPASDKTIIQIPDRPVQEAKQITVTDNAITVTNSDSMEEYVLVKKGDNSDWSNANTTGKFTVLEADTEYELYVRKKATENSFVSEPVKIEIRTKEHTMQKTDAKAPTCIKAGNQEYFTCTDCGKLFEDAGGTTETDSNKVIIPATGHKYPAQWTVEKEATESESGKKYKICETCRIKIWQTIEPTGTPIDPNAGKIEKEVEVQPGAPDTLLNNSKEELAKSILEPEEIAKVDSGAADAKIWLEITPEVDITETDNKKVQSAAEESVGIGAEVTYFDASLFKQVGNEEKIIIHEPKIPVSVTIVIPEEIRNKDILMVRNYQIIRLHGEKIDMIEGTYNEESAEFTFETDKFSTYALAYRDVLKNPTAVTLDKENITLTKVGETAQLTVGVVPADVTNKKVTWTTSDPKVATVDADGKVTAIGEGSCTITATTEDGSKAAVCSVTVNGTQQEILTGSGSSAVEKKEQEKNELSLNAKLKVSQTGKNINIAWGKVAGADGYDVYVQYCGMKFTKKSIIAIKSGKTTKVTVKKVNKKPLNLKKNYKIYVLSYKLVDGKKITLGKTIIAHIVGKNNTKYTNVKAVKLKKSLYRLKKGKTAQIKARTVPVSPGKKQLSDKHAKELRYATTNKKVATVSKEGKIKAAGKGTCAIYVYARNGYAKKIKVTVK